MNRVLELCNFPKNSRIKKRIPIKSIVDSYETKKSDENLLRTQIKSIDLVAVLDSETTFLYPKEIDGFKYEQILVLDVELKLRSKNISLDKKLQSYFPNPTIIIYRLNDKYKLSSADKRVNHNDKTQAIVNDMFSSNFFSLDNVELNELVKALDYKKKRYKDILDLYKHYQNIIFNEVLTKITGLYPKTIFDAKLIKDSIRELGILEIEKSRLEASEKECIGMNEKMRFHNQKLDVIKKQENIKHRFMEEL